VGMHIRVDPRDVPRSLAARRLGLSEERFTDALPELLARGFPAPDPTTGLYDLDAIDAWRRGRNPHLFLTAPSQARDARSVVPSRLGGHRWAR
jgi:hypothetical protein